jgi:hypothetical protein
VPLTQTTERIERHDKRYAGKRLAISAPQFRGLVFTR